MEQHKFDNMERSTVRDPDWPIYYVNTTQRSIKITRKDGVSVILEPATYDDGKLVAGCRTPTDRDEAGNVNFIGDFWDVWITIDRTISEELGEDSFHTVFLMEASDEILYEFWTSMDLMEPEDWLMGMELSFVASKTES